MYEKLYIYIDLLVNKLRILHLRLRGAKIGKGVKSFGSFKVMKAKNQFVSNHPKFAAFFRNVLTGGVQEGTIIEITVTRPGEEPMTTNMKVQQSDIDLFQNLKDLNG